MDRRTVVIITLILMWVIFFSFLFIHFDKLGKSPCSICAKKMGEDVSCYSYDYIPITWEFLENGTAKKTVG